MPTYQSPTLRAISKGIADGPEPTLTLAGELQRLEQEFPKVPFGLYAEIDKAVKELNQIAETERAEAARALIDRVTGANA